jgi:hypothetical protein
MLILIPSSIGLLNNKAMGAFQYGIAPINYATGMPHDSWRKFLPYVIDTYKNLNPQVTQEGLVVWYRTQPGVACASGGTTGNTASQGQTVYDPSQILQDLVFYSALLGSNATVEVSIGGVVQSGSWRNEPMGGAGIYHGSVPFTGTGEVVVTIKRGSLIVAQMSGAAISNSCPGGIENWNAWVGEADGSS